MTQAPTPGPLDSESVKLLVTGDLVADGDLIGALKGSADGWGCATIIAPNGAEFSRILHKGFAFVGRPDDDGWIVHDGSKNNPAVALRIDVWFRGQPDPALTRNEPANGWADFQWERIAKWRPTAFRLAPTAPVEASGSEREAWACVDFNPDLRMSGEGYCLRCGRHQDEHARPQPSGETRECKACGAFKADRDASCTFCGLGPSAADAVASCLTERERAARIIAPSAFAEVKSRTDGKPTGTFKYADRDANRNDAYAKADAILALPRSPDREARDRLIDYLGQEFGDTYDCKRVWSAWSYGTMGEDDFDPVSDRIDDVADAILALLSARQQGEVRETIIKTIAFLKRDIDTPRINDTVESLLVDLVKADAILRGEA